MLNGDIGNELAPSVGCRFERVIRTEEGKLNRSAKAYLETIGRTISNVYLITTGDRRKCMAFCIKWAVPYFQVIECQSTLEIADVVREHDMLYYYDMDVPVLQNVNSRGAGKVEAKLWTSITL